MLRDLIRLLRVHQWVKNLLVFVAPLLGQAFAHAGALAQACTVFGAFCAAASGVYVINDLFDLQSDRAHPRKRERPFASGRLPLGFGVFGPLLLLLGIGVGWAVSPVTGAIVAGYTAVSLSYSAYLKTKPLVDIFALSMLYTLRLFAGQVALHVEPSMWLLSFSGFLFLALAFLKRYAEFQAIVASGKSYETRRGYSGKDVELLRTMGIACTFASTVVLSLYVNSEKPAAMHANLELLWGTVPILLFWQTRMWLAGSRGKMADDPIVYAARDWVSRLCLVLIVAVSAAAVYL
jgi:4-hydroxybenzoate polyprenyltransferase